MGKIRVLHCIETIYSGGVEQLRLTLAKGLDFDKFELKIICTNASGPLKDEFKELGVELIELGSFQSVFEIKKYLRVIAKVFEYKPHIIHGAVFEGNSMATIGGVFGNIPVVILEETSDPQKRTRKANLLLKFFINFSDKIIAISPNVEKYLKNKVGAANNKVELINNGVRIPKDFDKNFVESKKNELGIKKEDVVIGFVGRLDDDIKRVSDLIMAISFLKILNVKVIIIGNGKDRLKIDSLINSLNLSDSILMLGFQGDMSVYYLMMDILCVPSSREGFGLVSVEGMLNKLPIIASNVGGLQEIVIDKETGFLVNPYSPTEIAEKLDILINDQELRKSFGAKGYERALKYYTSERYCRELINLYTRLLKTKGLIGE